MTKQLSERCNAGSDCGSVVAAAPTRLGCQVQPEPGCGRHVECNVGASGGLVWDQALKAWRGAIFQSGDNFILSMTLVGRRRNFQSKQDYLRYEVNITPSGTNTSEVCFDNDPSASDPTERKKLKSTTIYSLSVRRWYENTSLT